MKRTTMILTLLVALLPAGAVVSAQSDEWPTRGVPRESADHKPNEAGALPESSPSGHLSPDGSQNESAPAYSERRPQDAATAAETAAAPDTDAALSTLPATASPLTTITVSGLIFLGAAAALYRLREQARH